MWTENTHKASDFCLQHFIFQQVLKGLSATTLENCQLPGGLHHIVSYLVIHVISHFGSLNK